MSLLSPFTSNRQIALPGADGLSSRLGRLRFPASLTTILFVVMVAIPVVASLAYYGLIASDRYVSESRFLVRSASSNSIGGLASFLQTFGLSRADDDAYAVQSYIKSRDALRDLMEVLPMREILNRPEADIVTQCMKPWSKDTFETLYNCYEARVDVVREDLTGINVLSVDLYRPEDAQAVVLELIRFSEGLANEMNVRAEQDALANARGLMSEAEERVKKAQAELTDFRNRQLFIDPEGGSSPTSAVIAGLTQRLAQTRTQLDQQLSTSPSNPLVQSLRVQVEVIEEQIRQEQLKLTGGVDSISNHMSAYENLVLQRDLADQSMSIASNAIDQARQEARRQSIYVQTVVDPNLPDEATRPNRLRMIISVLIVSLFFYSVVWLVVLGGREHLDRAS